MVECACDPPGSGEEFCTGHCVLRAENEELREYGLQAASELGTLIAENERLRIIEKAVRKRIKQHDDHWQQQFGDGSCRDRFCQTFRPLVRPKDAYRPAGRRVAVPRVPRECAEEN